MNITEKERSRLRSLAEQYVSLASSKDQKEKRRLWRKLNGLQMERPMFMISKPPWKEIGLKYDFVNVVESDNALVSRAEMELRKHIFSMTEFNDDTICNPYWSVSPVVLHPRRNASAITDTADHNSEQVKCHQYEPQIKDETDLQKLDLIGEISVDEEETAAQYEFYDKLFGDIIPVKKRGIYFFTYNPWDMLIGLWGVEQAMIDLVLKPDLVHMAMEKITAIQIDLLGQIEALRLLSSNNEFIRVGSGAYGITDDLPYYAGSDPCPVSKTDIWASCTSQIFSEVSPEMHWQFALQYEKKWMEQFGLSYYGCCEPLHKKIDILRKVRNLRKISMSPWVDVEEGARQINGDYVFSYKPNPAVIATPELDEDVARDEIKTVLKAAKTHGCAIELIMKDITTLSNNADNLLKWAEIARDLIDIY